MKSRLLLSACFVIAVASAQLVAAADEPKWSVYTSKESGFSAEFPNANVKVNKNKATTTYNTSMAGLDSDFRVGVTAPVKLQPNEATARKELLRIRTVALSEAKDTIKNSQDTTVSGFPALEFDFQLEIQGSKLTYRMRYVLAKTRFYQQVVGHEVGKDLSKEGERFFKSLKISADEPSAAVAVAPGFAPPTMGTIAEVDLARKSITVTAYAWKPVYETRAVKVTVNGKEEERTVTDMRMVQETMQTRIPLRAGLVRDLTGKVLTEAVIAERLKPLAPVLMGVGAKGLDPFYARFYSAEVLVLLKDDDGAGNVNGPAPAPPTAAPAP